MIADPTSVTVKNVTPHCSQIYEILEFFKIIWFEFEKIMDITSKRFEENNKEVPIEEIDQVMRAVIIELVGNEKTLLQKIMRLIPCADCVDNEDIDVLEFN